MKMSPLNFTNIRSFGRVIALIVVFPLLLAADDSAATNAANAAPAAPADSALPITLSNDLGVGSDGTIKDEGSYQVRIGELFAPYGEAYIIPLKIPSLAPSQHIATAHLRFQLVGMNNESNGLANADLYALGVRDTDKATPSDYYQGAKADPKATLLQANFLTPASAVRTDQVTGPFVESSKDGDAALAKLLDDVCSKPANTGKYLVLRISYDADPIPTGNNAYLLLSSGASGEKETPLITYTLKK